MADMYYELTNVPERSYQTVGVDGKMTKTPETNYVYQSQK